MFRLSGIAFVLSLTIGFAIARAPVSAQRPTRPTRDPNTAGYVAAKDLPDGVLPPATADGNFIIGPTHTAAPEMTWNRPIARSILASGANLTPLAKPEALEYLWQGYKGK